MTQHLTIRHDVDGLHRTACGRWVGPDKATGVAGTTCRRCMATAVYEARRDDTKASDQ